MKFSIRFPFLCSCALLTLTLTAPLSAADGNWPQWRGPERDGHRHGPAFPAALDEAHLTSLWKVALGPSYSGPIIQNGIVYTTETANEEREVVQAYALETGEPRWKTGWEGVMRVPFFARSNGSWIRSTPATDGERLYVAGMRDKLVCLDARTGAELWSRDFVKEFGTDLPAFGFVCSPLLTERAVIVQAGASVVALDKRSGKLLWRSLKDAGGMNGSAFSSPILGQLGGQTQLLVQTRSDLSALEPSDGAVLWSRKIPAFRGMNILTPTLHDGLVFTTAYGGRAMGIRPKKTAASWTTDVAWDLKLEGYMASPVIIGNHAYVHLRNQRFACVDLRTGESCWQTKKKFGKYWSMIACQDQILALDERGELLLIAANPSEFELRASRKLDVKECWAHLALAGDYLAVRSLKQLEIFRWKAPKA